MTIVMNITIVLFGIIGYTYLGVREFPSIDPAQVSIRTNYTGANSDIIESQITEPLEKAINSIDGIRNITSSSSQGNSSITVEFNLDKDLEEAANDVRDKVSQAIRSLPQDIETKTHQIHQMEAELDDPDLYAKDAEKFQSISDNLVKARDQLEAVEMRWLELEEMKEAEVAEQTEMAEKKMELEATVAAADRPASSTASGSKESKVEGSKPTGGSPASDPSNR